MIITVKNLNTIFKFLFPKCLLKSKPDLIMFKKRKRKGLY